MPVRRMKTIEELVDDEEVVEEERPKRRAPRKEEAPAAEEEVFEDEDEDEQPERSSLVQSGWKAAKEMRDTNSGGGGFINDFRWTEEPKLVKFLSEGPISYRQHWVDRTSGKRSHVCLGKGCPLCAVGNRASAKHAFSVVDLTEDEPTVSLLVVGNRLLQQLDTYHESPKTGPLTKGYWALSRTGKGRDTSHTVQFVKARDLEEDWDLDQEEIEDLLADLEPADESAIVVTPRTQLKELADGLS